MMDEQIQKYIEQYPGEIANLFMILRQLLCTSVSASLDERMWAKLPSYYVGASVVRLIPFRDHINVEARTVVDHAGELSGYKITPKGMLQIFVNQPIPTEVLKQIFAETLHL